MKKWIGILLTTLLLFGVAFAAEPVDLTTYTDAELLALVAQAGAELRARNTPVIPDDPLADLRYASNGKEVRINAYVGATGIVYIPDEIDGVPVTQIYDDMCNEFNNNLDICSLRLPKGLVSIGSSAFKSTYDLEQVLVMPKTLQKIGNSAFCWSDLTGVVLQSDCVLSSQAFAMGDKLKFCYIREGCTVELGSLAFQDTPLETIVIPADVTKISSSTFSSCNQLTVYCPAGSYAEKYCLENFIVCDTANYEAMVAYYEALYPAE